MGGCNSKPSSSGAVVTSTSTTAPENQRRLQEAGDASRSFPSSSAAETQSPLTPQRPADIKSRPPELQHESPIEHDADEQSQEWNELFTSVSAHIVDPQDLPSVLDSLISQTVNALAPVEVSFVKRRVKHSLRWINKCIENGIDDDGRNGTTSISGKVGRLVSSGFNIGATASSSSSIHYNGGDKSLHGNNGTAMDRSMKYYTCHPSLDESTTASLKSSKATYQKDRLMDINVVRKVFEGGERTLRLLQACVRADLMGDDGLWTNASNVDGGVGGMVVPKRRSITKLGLSGESSHSNVGSNANTNDTYVQTFKDSDREAIDKIDIYGSAFLLLSYMSESRWDYITEIAKLSAEKASLITDVNDLALLEKEHTTTSSSEEVENRNKESIRDDDSDSGKSLMNGLRKAPASHYAQKKTPYPPPSPSFVPPSQTYNLPDLICNEPAGITLPSLCYIIALALRGSRRQKLNLLFYLLLPPKELDMLLASHPAGGLPTWLLEVDGGLVLTYDSLSYYYNYECVMTPFEVTAYGGSENGFSFGSTNQAECVRRRLTIDARMSIEILSALLADSAVGSSWLSPGEEKNGWSDQGYSYGTRRLRSLVTAPDLGKDINSSMLVKCEGIHELLHAGVEGNSLSAPTVEELKLLEQFLECAGETSKIPARNLSSPPSRTLWSMQDFVKWADGSLNDSLLNNLMHRLFGCGILPCAEMERKVVSHRWVEWNKKDFDDSTSSSRLSVVNSPARGGFRSIFTAQKSDQDSEGKLVSVGNQQNRVWGGIGGFDGNGGLGHGVLYCIDKHWWDDWVAYTGWQFGKCTHSHPITLQRPRELSTERLIERSAEAPFVAGTRGSYEPMRSGLSPEEDYVLIPPGVWNVLYDLYGGGPPLPRMVLPGTSTSPRDERNGVHETNDLEPIEYECSETVPSNVSSTCRENYPIAIPRSVRVATHPWIIHCQICDPQQPYRRGDAGPMSIRIMTMPEQPLWRLFSEVVLRLPISHPKSKDSHGEGRARLWRFEANDKTPNTLSRYGPWALLCKNRFAEIPIYTRQSEKYEDSWKSYADQNSVESVGLLDGTRIMFEYAVLNKDGSFSWPREAAAKATRLRRIADEDAAFRLVLRGLDSEGKPGRTSILKTLVDVMDSSGRWYQSIIINVNSTARPPDSCESPDENEHSETASDEADPENAEFREITFVRVHYKDYAGNNHEEWIDVKSDRLAVGGRFTASVPNLENDIGVDESTANEPKSRLSGANKKKDSNESAQSESNTAMCLFPSYGACGLVNLGNTCYANSGWQCMSYLPLLRAYLLSGQYKVYGDLNRDNPLGTGGRLLEEFAELMHVMWSGKFGSRAPNKFRNFLGKCRPQYSGADQQDAQELINDMIDMLHEDGNRVKKKPYVAALEDNFIEKTELRRVGQESWRRFLRRNRSAISDLAMGQVYNRVTCPVCNHSSKNFDPFNILSLPFPTVAEVIFQCTVVRRATNLNCPRTLLMVHRRQQTSERNGSSPSTAAPPSKGLVFEEYIIPMSRLADIGDLKMKLQNVTGIASSRFRICKKEEIVTGMGKDEPFAAQVYHKVSALPDKEGPCVKLLHQVSLDDISAPMIAKIIAFESTLNPRPLSAESHDSKVDNSSSARSVEDDSSTVGEMSDDSASGPGASGVDQSKILEHTVHECLKYYGDEQECIVFDTNPTPLSKYVSRCLWPKSAQDFTLGLRVDAIDHRNNWFPGSVIEIIESQEDSSDTNNNGSDLIPQPRVKVHFDNFSSKWDEIYSIESFSSGRVCPLYSHATPRSKATEFLVHHRAMDRKNKQFYLFGQSFYLQCHNEWSTARAGAHILAQASRFLECPHFSINKNDTNVNVVDQKIAEKRRHETRKVIASIIEALLSSDRKYIQFAIESGKKAHDNKNHAQFDASNVSKALITNLNEVIPLLPFEIRVTTADSPLGSNKEETAFPFSLARTIGNYMNARHSLVLHWRDTPDHNSNSKSLHNKHVGRFRHILYAPPPSAPHESFSLLSANSNSSNKSPTENPSLRRHPSSSHGGMHIGVCLAEFCKEQRLDAADSWRCPVCKVEREGRQSMSLWNLPDLLTFHLKRFNASSRWREKITTKVDFPLTGLNMREWCDNESPMCLNSGDDIPFIYDLIGVVNHYGGMTGGHYVAMCKATACSPDGVEDVAHSFNGLGTADVEAIEEEVVPSGWRLGRSRDKDYSPNAASKAVAESAEPLWLQFDDDLVEPLPPRNVVSETAYVLFYRRRRMQASNVAKYSVLE
eukprot:CCRYP_002734-RB/>CCRYP_002734-RB protein AED:0.09 eAED:0.09 QI:174/1/1/1/0.66/0.5/4/1386/2251